MDRRRFLGITLAALIAVLAASGLAAQAGRAQTATPTAPAESARLRTISVSGTGTIDARPDEAFIQLGVQSEAESASEALQQNNEQMEALLQALTEAGVAREDIQTQFVSLHPRFSEQPVEGGAPPVTGYIAMNMVEVRVRDLDQLGELLDAAVAAGGNTVSGIRFGVSEQSELLSQARAEAMDEARAKAEQLATLAGATLGPVLSINEGAAPPVPFFGPEAGIGGGAAVPIEPGLESMQVTLQVTWLLSD